MVIISFVFRINIMLLIIFYYLSFSIYSSSIIMFGKAFVPILLIVIWLTEIILNNKKKIYKIPMKIFTLFFIFFFFAFVSIFMSTNAMISITEIFGLISLFILTLYVIPSYVNKQEEYLKFLKIFNRILFLLLIIGLIIGNTNLIPTITSFGARIRYKGIFKNANGLGTYTMLGAVVSIILLYLEKRKIHLFPLVLNIYIMFLSDSRTSLISTMIFGMIIFMFYIYKEDKYYKGFVKNIMIVLILIVSLLFFTNTEFISIEELNIILSGRIDRWVAPLLKIKTNKALFWGNGGQYNGVNPHNFLIKMISDWGVISGIIFLLIIILLIINVTKLIINSKNNLYLNNISKINLALIVTFLFVSNFESLFFNVGNLSSIFLWSNIGILMSSRRLIQKK